MRFNLPQQKKKAIDFIQDNNNKLICSINKLVNIRSIYLNNYYWLLLTMLESETGIDKNDWHDFFGEKFRRSTKEFNGEILEFTKSTTIFKTSEFIDYLGKIRVYASIEIGCFLPLPNETEYDYLKF